jgi:hypothetical protein
MSATAVSVSASGDSPAAVNGCEREEAGALACPVGHRVFAAVAVGLADVPPRLDRICMSWTAASPGVTATVFDGNGEEPIVWSLHRWRVISHQQRLVTVTVLVFWFSSHITQDVLI